MSESADRVRDLLEHVSDALALDATVDIVEEGREIHATLEGDDLGLFIGRHGQTIDAVQHLALKTATRDQPPSAGVRVVVDAAGYRERREQALQRQADEAAGDAVRSKRPVALDAMSATERMSCTSTSRIATTWRRTPRAPSPTVTSSWRRCPRRVSRETLGRRGSAGRGGAARRCAGAPIRRPDGLDHRSRHR